MTKQFGCVRNFLYSTRASSLDTSGDLLFGGKIANGVDTEEHGKFQRRHYFLIRTKETSRSRIQKITQKKKYCDTGTTGTNYTPVVSTYYAYPLHTTSGCRKERRILFVP